MQFNGQKFSGLLEKLSFNPRFLAKNVKRCCFVTPIVGVFNCSMFCCTLLYVHSSFAILLMGKRELVALLSLSYWCLVIAVWLFLAAPWVCLQVVIVVFYDHTHLLFFMEESISI